MTKILATKISKESMLQFNMTKQNLFHFTNNKSKILIQETIINYQFVHLNFRFFFNDNFASF